MQAQNQLLAQFSQSERKDEGALDGRLYRERNEKKPPILANRLALGYTYIDVTDDADPDGKISFQPHLVHPHRSC